MKSNLFTTEWHKMKSDIVSGGLISTDLHESVAILRRRQNNFAIHQCGRQKWWHLSLIFYIASSPVFANRVPLPVLAFTRRPIPRSVELTVGYKWQHASTSTRDLSCFDNVLLHVRPSVTTSSRRLTESATFSITDARWHIATGEDGDPSALFGLGSVMGFVKIRWVVWGR